MKVTSAAVTLLASSVPAAALAANDECIAGGFSLELDGTCTAASVVAAYADQVFDAVGARSKSCQLDAAADLHAKVSAAGLAGVDALCDQVYTTQEKVPFTDASNRGSDLRFEEMFFDGRTDWQEEVETVYETEDGARTSVLKKDAQHIRAFYRGVAQGRRVEWPGALSHFQSDVKDADDLATCATNAAMCCWPQDRQANDNNGNCATPYDENCVDKDPADNTDLCFVDPARGNASTGYDAPDGVLVYPDDNGRGEGAIHCHGLAWSNDVNDHTARYKANNLFYVSMYDHMYQRGYVKNVPGAPMCGCVEQMPTVSRSDCTQVDLTETIQITYNPEANIPFHSKLTSVEIDFNACQGINNRNNDLWAYMARLYYQGDITPSQFGKAGRTITDNGCGEATRFALNDRHLTAGYDHDVATWTNVAGRDALRLHDHYGHRAFARSLTPSTTDPNNTHYGIIYRACASCIQTHRKIFYRRRTPVPEGFDLLDNILYRKSSGDGANKWTEDFSLHSSYKDALDDVNPWKCPGDSFQYGYTFYGRCSPDGTRVSTARSLFHYQGDRNDVAYYTNKAEADGLQEVPTVAINGGGRARGIALRDPATGSIYMTGAGYNFAGGRNDFNYLPEAAPADADRTAVVHVGGVSTVKYDPWSKAGLMFRADLSPEAPYYTVWLAGKKQVCFHSRNTKGANFQGGTCTGSDVTSAWLKLEKRGHAYSAFVGAEDEGGSVAWTLLNTREIPTIAEAETYQVGLAVVSKEYVVMEAIFEHYQVDA